MAQNKSKKKVEQKKVEPQKVYKNPTDSRWGHILILILAISMSLVSVGVLIYYIVKLATTV